MNAAQKKSKSFAKRLDFVAIFVVIYILDVNSKEDVVSETLDNENGSGDYNMDRAKYLFVTKSKLNFKHQVPRVNFKEGGEKNGEKV